MQDKGKYIRFAPSQQKAVAWSDYTFYSKPNLQLYHQHDPSFCLHKHIGIATNYRINLIGCNWLSILADMQLLAVNHFRNLFSSHPSVLACEAVKYGFFNFHISILRHKFFNQSFQDVSIQVCNPLFL